MKWRIAILAVVLGLAALCSSDLVNPGRSEIIDAATPVPAVGELGGPFRALSDAELTSFLAGRAVFDHDWHEDEGLGTPDLNADSCRACHQSPTIGGHGGLDQNVSRFGFDNGGAGPFMDLPGGQGLSKLRQPNAPLREEHDAMADVFEQRQTPSIFGLGRLDTISDATIIANQALQASIPDGIAGLARMIDVNGVMEVGRFGWKAQIPRLTDFVNDAGAGELGLTLPDNSRGFGITSDGDGAADPELSITEREDMAFFMAMLAPPARVGSNDPMVAEGEILFTTIGCATCHIPTLMGSEGPVNAYTDLLVHSVMPAGFRGMSEPNAPAGTFRTSPLWGIRLSAPYMHDGRAETLEDAIRSHFGEANDAATAFDGDLAGSQRQALLKFLEDL